MNPPQVGVVHLWWSTLHATASELGELHRVLSSDEVAWAMQFRLPEDRERAVVRRGRLRLLLGRYLCVEPASLRFSYTQHGKPALVGALGTPRLCFNLSYSGDTVLYGVTADRELGVDLEQVRQISVDALVTDYFLTPQELQMLRGVSTAARQATFFACWTLKEAYVKGTGEGLTADFADLDVSAAQTGRGVMEHTGWSLRRVHAGAGYACALALAGDLQGVEHRRWPLEWQI